MKRGLLVISALSLAACRASGTADGGTVSAPTAQSTPVGDTPTTRGRAFAEGRCARCHGVIAGSVSPNPDSPPFEAIANTPGLTPESLHAWLSNAHDFPAEMYFALEPGDVDDLVAYMVTLRRADYEPPVG